MSTSKYIDKICIVAIVITLIITCIFMNGKSLGVVSAEKKLGYEDLLFSADKVHKIDIVMDNWDSFIETCENEQYSSCTIVIDGEKYSNVGIRAKGNTSLSSVKSAGSERYSFKIEFDQYVDGKSYYGLDKLCLNNLIQDNTMMKDYLVYQMMDEFGVDSPLSSYVYITVNGQDWGLYLAVEAVEDSFLERNYGSENGDLYKPDSLSFGGGRGNGQGFDMSNFDFSGLSDQFSQGGNQKPNNNQNSKGEDNQSNDSQQDNQQEGNESQNDSSLENQIPGFNGDMSQLPNGQMPNGNNGWDSSQMPGGGNFQMPSDGNFQMPGNSGEWDNPQIPSVGFDMSQMPNGFNGQMPNGNNGWDFSQNPNGGNSTSNGTVTNTSSDLSGGQTPPSGNDGSGSKPNSGSFGGFSGGGDFISNMGGFGMGSDDVKLKYIDDDPDSYSNIFDNAKTNVTKSDKERLINSLKNLTNYENLEDTLDIEEVLRYFVVHNFVVNGDSYTGSMIHNYYLYESDGQLSMIPWDYNLAFGTFMGGSGTSSVNSSIDNPVASGSVDDRPMVGWIFSSEEYTEKYHELFAEFMEEWIDSGKLEKLIDDTYELIKPYVEKDPTKFCTTEQFETGVSTIKEFVSLRGEAVDRQLAKDNSPVGASGLNTSDMGSMGGNFGGGGANTPSNSDKPNKSESSDLNGNWSFSPNDIPSFSQDQSNNGGNNTPGFSSPASNLPGGVSFDTQSMGASSITGISSNLSSWLLIGVSAIVLIGGLAIAIKKKI